MRTGTSNKRVSFDPATFLAKAGAGKTLATYRKGQTVFAQSDLADAIFYVQKGKVKLTVVSNNGKEAVIALLGLGDFFGEGCLAGKRMRMATATAPSRLLDYATGEGCRGPRAPRRTRIL